MGAWGDGPFENDLAADLLADWSDAADATDMVLAWLERAISQSGYLEEPDASGAVAAAACAVGVLTDGEAAARVRDDVDGVAFDEDRADELLARSAQAIDRVLAPDSELLDLWDDAGEAEPFREQLLELRAACTS